MSSITTIGLRQSTMRTLLYFDIFHYPLRASEVLYYLDIPSTESHVEDCLNELVAEGKAYKFGEFYSLHNSLKDIDRRIDGNKRAARHLPLARKRASLISRFPFVRAVLISGSLSKNYMDEDSDVDFFIITRPGGLWIARTLLVLFKRIFLLNSKKLFCVNYFVSTHHLEIRERNIFTAVELASLLPMTGRSLYEQLINNNARWLKTFLPNRVNQSLKLVPDGEQSVFQKICEKGLDLLCPWTDNFLMRVTHSRWKKMYSAKLDATDFDVAFRTSKDVAKSHPKFYQKQVLDKLQRKLHQAEIILETSNVHG